MSAGKREQTERRMRFIWVRESRFRSTQMSAEGAHVTPSLSSYSWQRDSLRDLRFPRHRRCTRSSYTASRLLLTCVRASEAPCVSTGVSLSHAVSRLEYERERESVCVCVCGFFWRLLLLLVMDGVVVAASQHRETVLRVLNPLPARRIDLAAFCRT